MQSISIWDGFYKSFTEPRAYDGFRAASTGKVMLHTVLVALIITLLVGLPMVYEFNRVVSETMYWAQQDMPNFEVRQGKLMVDAPMPIILGQGEQAFIVDTTGYITLETLGPTFTGILVTESTIYHRKNQFETQSFDLSTIQSFSKAQLLTWIPYLRWIMPLITIFMFGFYLVGNLLVALIGAFVYNISGKGKSKGLAFGELYKLMLFSMTLPRLFIGVFALVSLSIPYYFVLTLALTVFFAHRGV